MTINIKLVENGVMPKKAHADDACFDCYAGMNTIVNPNSTMIVPLGFKLELPSGYEAQIRGRSGLSKQGVKVDFGTVDANYRGEVCASIYNAKDTPFLINKGERICQMAICPVLDITFNAVEEISDSERGTNGFGSTGK